MAAPFALLAACGARPLELHVSSRSQLMMFQRGSCWRVQQDEARYYLRLAQVFSALGVLNVMVEENNEVGRIMHATSCWK